MTGIKFGEELRASPPKRVSEITIRQSISNVVRPLFQAGVQGSRLAICSKVRRVKPEAKEAETSTS
jgi:hypothetical protein